MRDKLHVQSSDLIEHLKSDLMDKDHLPMTYIKPKRFLIPMLYLFLILFIVPAFAQQVEFKTTCNKKDCSIVAFEKEVMLGYARLNECYMTHILVYDQFQKKGYGKALLEQARRQAEKHNCSEIALMPLSKLIPYYQRNGFTCEEHRCTHPL